MTVSNINYLCMTSKNKKETTQINGILNDNKLEKLFLEHQYIVLIGIASLYFFKWRQNHITSGDKFHAGLGFTLCNNYNVDEMVHEFFGKDIEGKKYFDTAFVTMYNLPLSQTDLAHSIYFETFESKSKPMKVNYFYHGLLGAFKSPKNISDKVEDNQFREEKHSNDIRKLAHNMALYCGYKSYQDFLKRFPVNLKVSNEQLLCSQIIQNGYVEKSNFRDISEEALNAISQFDNSDRKGISYLLLYHAMVSIGCNVGIYFDDIKIHDYISKRFVLVQSCKNFEFTVKNLEISVITPDLVWLKGYWNDIIESIKENNSTFNYIVVNGLNGNGNVEDTVLQRIRWVKRQLEEDPLPVGKENNLKIINIRGNELQRISKGIDKHDPDLETINRWLGVDIPRIVFPLSNFPFDMIVYSNFSMNDVYKTQWNYVDLQELPKGKELLSLGLVRPSVDFNERGNLNLCMNTELTFKINELCQAVISIYTKYKSKSKTNN